MRISTLLFILFLLSPVFAFSQAMYPVPFEQKADHATLIVEARAVKSKSFWNPAHTMIYTAWDLDVYKVFKGDLPSATLQVMTTGGVVGDEEIRASELLRLREGHTGVFFLYPNALGLVAPEAVHPLYDVYASAQGLLRYNPFLEDGAHAPFEHYGQISELYEALQGISGYNYREVKPLFMRQKPAGAANKGTATTISGWSPARIHAGALRDVANNTLTITGTGFGNGSGLASIQFDDADDGTNGLFDTLAYNNPLVTSWSNTQIVVKVPQYVGTGVFKIYDNTGALAATSSSNLIVDYSVMTSTFSGVTEEVNMMNTNVTGGYSLSYSTSTAGSAVNMLTSQALPTFQRALTSQRNQGGMNFSDSTAGVINSTTTQTVNPGVLPNVIEYDNSNTGVGQLPSGVLATCYSSFGKCSGGAVRRLGFDVVIRNTAYTSDASTSFTYGPCAPSEYNVGFLDLETVILHELGHGANQNHVNENYQYAGSGAYPAVNPGAVMNFALLNGVKRASFDYPLLSGETYSRTQKGLTYGTCAGSPFLEMTPLTTTISSRDECSSVFPAPKLVSGTGVSFDLVNATSNKYTDPQYTAFRTTGTGTNVTNTAYYAFQTPASVTTVNLNISSFTPAATCGTGGVELALYAASSCPTGQSYPTPVQTRTFTADGSVSAFSGLTANTTYIMVADGLENTKSTFTATFSFTTPLPIKLLDFRGRTQGHSNVLSWQFSQSGLPAGCILERSADGQAFSTLYEDQRITTDEFYTDTDPLNGTNFYRLKMTNADGSTEYSTIVALVQKHEGDTWVAPLPVVHTAVLHVNSADGGALQAHLFHASGQQVANWNWQASAGDNAFVLDLAPFAAGCYILQVTGAGNDAPVVLKVMKQ